MPTGGLFDCCGFMTCVLGDDGKYRPVDLSQTVTLSPDLDDEENWWDASNALSVTLAIVSTKENIAFVRKLERNRKRMMRKIRREKRRKEKERRRRLKEGK